MLRFQLPPSCLVLVGKCYADVIDLWWERQTSS